MTADDFVRIVRSGNDKLRVDDIAIQTGEAEIHGKGMLKIANQQIEVDVTIDSDEQLPEMTTGVFTKRDSWKVGGIIEDHLRFRCDSVGPVGNRQWYNNRTKITFKLHPLELIPSGWEAMTREESAEFLKSQNQQRLAGRQTPWEPQPTLDGDSAQFHAVLLHYPLISANRGSQAADRGFFEELRKSHSRSFVGEIGSFDFGLYRDGEDLHVHLRSKEGVRVGTIQEDWISFYALMSALAFAQGVNAWPYRIEYWRNGQKLTDRITAAADLPETAHAPFTETLAFNATTGSVKWEFGEVLKKAAHFFKQNSTLTKEVAQILFLFRQADSGVHSEITTLAMCALLENLMHAIFKGLNLREQELERNPDLGAFETAKKWTRDQVSKELAARTPSDRAGLERLQRIIQSAGLFSQREIFQTICSHLGLTWEKDMELAFDTWGKARHPLVHQRERANQSEDELRESMLNESRVAGTINILILKLMGYSGWVRESAFEDKYRQI